MHFFIEHPMFINTVFKVYADTQEEAKNEALKYLKANWPETNIPESELKLGGEGRPDVIPLICSIENAAKRYLDAHAICNHANNILWTASIEMREIEQAMTMHLPNGISIIKVYDKQSIWRLDADGGKAWCLEVAANIIHDQKEG